MYADQSQSGLDEYISDSWLVVRDWSVSTQWEKTTQITYQKHGKPAYNKEEIEANVGACSHDALAMKITNKPTTLLTLFVTAHENTVYGLQFSIVTS